MRRYETIFILDPDLSEEGRVPVFDKLNELIPAQGGTLLEMDQWGLRRLAYEIKKKPRGYYVRVDYCGSGAVVNEMERFFRIDDRVLKYMTVLLDKDADVERLKAELTKTETQEEEPAEAESNEAESGQTPVETPEPAEPEVNDVKDEKPDTDTNKEA